MRTLVLDQGYQPHRVVSWQRAVGMLFVGKVEVLEEYDEWIRSVSLSIQMPAVVRLIRAVKRRQPPIRFSRLNVMTRDGFSCQYCAVDLPMRDLTYDHVLPRSRGGRTTWENVVTACKPCNHAKGDRTPSEAGMPLLRTPVKPTWLPARAVAATGGVVPERWRDYLV